MKSVGSNLVELTQLLILSLMLVVDGGYLCEVGGIVSGCIALNSED